MTTLPPFRTSLGLEESDEQESLGSKASGPLSVPILLCEETA